MGSKKRKKSGGNPALRPPLDAQTRASTRPTDSAAGSPDTLGVDFDGRADRAADAVSEIGVRAQARPPQERPAAIEAILQMPVDERQPGAQGWLPGALEEIEPQAVAVTYSFQSPQAESFHAAIRFTGLRLGLEGDPTPRDQFRRIEQLDNLPGNGDVISVTTRVEGVNRGDWRVLAQPVTHPDGTHLRSPAKMIETTSHFGHLAQGPGVHVWAWPLLIGLGAALALMVQVLLAARWGLPALGVLALSVLGCLLGFVGAKLWYLGLHRKPLREIIRAGACIQGFLLVALAALALGSLTAGYPVGKVLDLTAPGIFLGVAVGRPGCLLTGCCAGRPTHSRWGVVSSNRRLRVRRVPVQLYEALSGLVIGAASFVAVLGNVPVAGSVFVGAIAAYVLARQLLFSLRVESRTRPGRLVTMAISGLILLGAAGTSFA